MNTAVINIKTEPKLKIQAQQVASELGFSLSSLINGYLKTLVKTKTIFFSTHNEEPTEYLLKALKESDNDIKNGRVYSFDQPNDAVSFLDKLIKK